MISILIAIVFCCGLSLSSSRVNADPIVEEFRAVWIATVANIDWPSSNTIPPAQQQQELIDILNTVQRLNMNVVVFHVRKEEIDWQRRTFEYCRFDLLVMLYMSHHWNHGVTI